MARSPGPGRIFLCHSSGDKAAVRGLYHRLNADGFKPWLDENDLLPGQDWAHEIPIAVRASHVVLVCLSRSATSKRGYIQKEIKLALDAADELPEGQIFVIPAKLEACDVPTRLARWQWVDLCDESGYPRLVRALRAATRAEPISGILTSPSASETSSIPPTPPRESSRRMSGTSIAFGLGLAMLIIVAAAARIDRIVTRVFMTAPSVPSEKIRSGSPAPAQPVPSSNSESSPRPAPPDKGPPVTKLPLVVTKPPRESQRSAVPAVRSSGPSSTANHGLIGSVDPPVEPPLPPLGPPRRFEDATITGLANARVGQDIWFSIKSRVEAKVKIELPLALVAIKDGREQPDISSMSWQANPWSSPAFVVRANRPGRHCLKLISVVAGTDTELEDVCVNVD